MSWSDGDGMADWDLTKIPDQIGVIGRKEWLPDWKSMASTKAEAKQWQDSKWGKYVQELFSRGGCLPSKVKAGVKAEDAMKALAVVRCVMGSWDPSHEHKIAGCAWILDRYFEFWEPEAK